MCFNPDECVTMWDEWMLSRTNVTFTFCRLSCRLSCHHPSSEESPSPHLGLLPPLPPPPQMFPSTWKRQVEFICLWRNTPFKSKIWLSTIQWFANYSLSFIFDALLPPCNAPFLFLGHPFGQLRVHFSWNDKPGRMSKKLGRMSQKRDECYNSGTNVPDALSRASLLRLARMVGSQRMKSSFCLSVILRKASMSIPSSAACSSSVGGVGSCWEVDGLCLSGLSSFSSEKGSLLKIQQQHNCETVQEYSI